MTMSVVVCVCVHICMQALVTALQVNTFGKTRKSTLSMHYLVMLSLWHTQQAPSRRRTAMSRLQSGQAQARPSWISWLLSASGRV